MLKTVTSLVRIKNVAATALIVAALCAVAFSAISVQPQNDAQAQNAKRIIVSTPTAATEGGTNGSLTVKLSAEPSGNVQVEVASTNPNDGGVQLHPNNQATGQTRVALTFTTTNYSTPQTVYIIAQSDTNGADETVNLEVEPERDTAYTLDPDYRALPKFTVPATVNDDDQNIIYAIDSSDSNESACSTTTQVDSGNPFEITEGTSKTYCVRLGTTSGNNGEPRQWADATLQAANPVTVTIASNNEDVTIDTDPELGWQPKHPDLYRRPHRC